MTVFATHHPLTFTVEKTDWGQNVTQLILFRIMKDYKNEQRFKEHVKAKFKTDWTWVSILQNANLGFLPPELTRRSGGVGQSRPWGGFRGRMAGHPGAEEVGRPREADETVLLPAFSSGLLPFLNLSPAPLLFPSLSFFLHILPC